MLLQHVLVQVGGAGVAPGAPPFVIAVGALGAVGLVLVGGVRAVASAVRAGRRLHARTRTRGRLRELDRMDGVAFEGFMAAFFARLGFAVHMGRMGPDYGCDLVLERGGRRVALQLKRYAPHRRVGVAAVQAAVAGAGYVGADEAWVLTTSSFSRSARRLAARLRVRLIERRDLDAMLLSRNRLSAYLRALRRGGFRL